MVSMGWWNAAGGAAGTDVRDGDLGRYAAVNADAAPIA
jgi:hypothetical protein